MGGEFIKQSHSQLFCNQYSTALVCITAYMMPPIFKEKSTRTTMNAFSFGIHRFAPKTNARAGKSLNSLNKVRPRPQVAARHSQSRLGDSLVSKSTRLLFPILHQQLNSKRRPQRGKRLVLLMKRHTHGALFFNL